MKTFVISLLFFLSLNYLVMGLLNRIWKPDFYTKHGDDHTRKTGVVAMIISIIHHVIVSVAAIYTLFVLPPQSPPMSMIYSPNVKALEYYPFNS